MFARLKVSLLYTMHYSLNPTLHLYGPGPHAMWIVATGLMPHAISVGVSVCLIWRMSPEFLMNEHYETELGSAHSFCIVLLFNMLIVLLAT